MHFFNLIADGFAATTAVLASPMPVSAGSGEVAGSVVTNTSDTYYMNPLYEIKVTTGKGDYGYYPRPLTYEVKAGFTCIFYLEATLGVGSPIGTFAGTTTGVFKDWVTAYKYWPGTNSVTLDPITAREDLGDTKDAALMPCGFAHIPGYDNGILACSN